jgi:hypothetical protein
MGIEERVAKLEKQNRGMKIALIAGLPIVVLLGALGATSPQDRVPKEIRAEKFTLVDANERVRSTLDASNGWGELSLYDSNGGQRIFLGGSDRMANGKSTPLIEMRSENGGPIVMIGGTPSGGKLWFFADGKSEPGISLGMGAGRAAKNRPMPRIDLFDEDGKCRMAITCLPRGRLSGIAVEGPGITIYDKNGTPTKVFREPNNAR